MRKIETMWRQLSGHEIADPDKRADHIMHQMLIGTMVGDGNKVQVRDYIADQLKSMQQCGVAEGRRLERRALQRLMNQGHDDSVWTGGEIKQWLKQRTKPAKRKEGGR